MLMQKKIIQAQTSIAETNLPTLLLVEDAPTSRLMFQKVLARQGYQIKTAAGPAEAFKQLQNFTPGLVLMDYNLNNEINGAELAKQIQSKSPSVGIIFLTGETKEDGITDMMGANPVGFIRKDIETHDMFKALITLYWQNWQTWINAQETTHQLRVLNEALQTEKKKAEIRTQQAKDILDAMISPSRQEEIPGLQCYSKPHDIFSGDFTITKKLPERSIIFVGDFTGHGLASSMGITPINDIVQQFAARSKDLRIVCLMINEFMHEKMRLKNIFLAATILDIHHDTNKVDVWHFNNPELVICMPGNIQRVKSNHNVYFGTFNNKDMDPEVMTIDVEPGSHLLQFTDGVNEAVNDRDKMLTEEAVWEMLGQLNTFHDANTRIVDLVQRYIGESRNPDDDVTIINYLIP